MRIVAVSTVFNEADIIGATLTHLYGEGVDSIYIADGRSTDGTRDVLAQHPVKVYDDDAPYHHQSYWMSRLAQDAYEDGADWVLCVDADEFWCGALERTIADCLTLVPPSVGKVVVPMYQYSDLHYREPDWKPLRKVAFRARDGVHVANGNHDAAPPCGNPFGGVTGAGIVIREIQYRSFEHFCRKIEERNATIDPALPSTEGAHHKQYAGWSKEQLEPVWEAMVARATVYDPIPLRR